MKKMKKFVVVGGIWFDVVNGNSYNSAKIIDVDTKETHYTRFTYGYGSAYMVEAIDYIKNVLKIENYDVVDCGSFKMKKRVLKGQWW